MYDPRELTAPQLVLLLFGLVVAAGLVFAATTSASAFGAFNYAWDGSADLRNVPEAAGQDTDVLQNTSVYEQLDGQTMVVVLGPAEQYSDAATARIRSYLRRGGTLLIAGDFGVGANDLLAGVGASTRIDGRLVRDERNYGRSPAFPIATPVASNGLEETVSEIELNHPATLSGTDANGTTVLVTTSEYAYLDANRNDELDGSESLRAYPVASRESVGNGTVLTISDPSVFINSMLERRDNRAFATWLFEGYDRVSFDYTHAGGIPPLVQALLFVRSTSVTRFAFGAVLLGGVVFLLRTGPGIVARLRDSHRPSESVELTEDEIVSIVAERHPEWEPERVRRIASQLVVRRSDRVD